MPRDVTRNRLLTLLLFVLNAAWTYCAGSQIAFFAKNIHVTFDGFSCLPALLATWLLLVVVRAWQFSLAPDVAANIRMTHARLIGLLELLSLSCGLLGASWGFGPEFHHLFTSFGSGAKWATWEGMIFFLLGCATIPWLARIAASGEGRLPELKERWFFVDLRHVSNRLSLTYFFAGVLLVGLIGAGIAVCLSQLDWRLPEGEVALPATFHLFALAVLIGMAISTLQFHWHRAIGFVPWAFLLLCCGFLGRVVDSGSQWPVILIGLAAIGHSPLIAGLVAALPTRQRFGTLIAYHVAVTFSATLLGAVAIHMAPNAVPNRFTFVFLLACAAIGLIGFTYFLFRPFIELINELVFRFLWYPIAYGPGKYGLPTRGPALIVGNHAAMFDPVWLSGVIPLRNRAMMISTVLDKPFLKWLCGRVYQAIRVPAEGFRRNAPEIEEAIAALREGDTVMIFPEAWLRRKEEQPIRRFANGVHRILSQCPNTPVITCWIEDGWGSWTSWKNGPPGKNKPKDILKKIRIGINEAEILPADMLKDHISTRRYLMQRVLHARAHLGLPEYPMPSFGSREEKEE
jgi:1-acyl-sn-glycerol-3-phosphate acyltransferase